MSLMAAFPRAGSADVRFGLAFSVSSSRVRFRFAPVAPPRFLLRVKTVAPLIPCFRSATGIGRPPSTACRVSAIWLAVNFERRRTAPETRRLCATHAVGQRGELMP